jgi:uncharacterized protein with FMN-binding domain
MSTSGKSRRFGGRLAALSSAAILSVYAAGYVVTQGAARTADASGATPPADVPPSPQATSAAANTGASSTSTSKPLVTATATASAGALRDGVYVGTGTSRHGSIEATVTVAGGKISAVQISQCLTRYSCDWISGLPAQAVKLQSAQVNYVSGATDSSKAFVAAVKSALTHAQ